MIHTENQFLRIVVIGIIWTTVIPDGMGRRSLSIVVIGIIWTMQITMPLSFQFLRIVVIGIIWTLKDHVVSNFLGLNFMPVHYALKPLEKKFFLANNQLWSDIRLISCGLQQTDQSFFICRKQVCMPGWQFSTENIRSCINKPHTIVAPPSEPVDWL